MNAIDNFLSASSNSGHSSHGGKGGALTLAVMSDSDGSCLPLQSVGMGVGGGAPVGAVMRFTMLPPLGLLHQADGLAHVLLPSTAPRCAHYTFSIPSPMHAPTIYITVTANLHDMNLVWENLYAPRQPPKLQRGPPPPPCRRCCRGRGRRRDTRCRHKTCNPPRCPFTPPHALPDCHTCTCSCISRHTGGAGHCATGQQGAGSACRSTHVILACWGGHKEQRRQW